MIQGGDFVKVRMVAYRFLFEAWKLFACPATAPAASYRATAPAVSAYMVQGLQMKTSPENIQAQAYFQRCAACYCWSCLFVHTILLACLSQQNVCHSAISCPVAIMEAASQICHS